MTAVAQRGLAAVRRVLQNGLTAIGKESHATPAVTIHAGIRAGSASDPDDTLGLAYFTSRVLDRGAEGWTADAIAEDLDNRGVSLQVVVNRHLVTIEATCLVEDLDAILRLLAQILMRPTFPPGELETRRVEILTAIRQDEDNPAVMATEELMSLLYPGHPYGRRSKGTIASVDAIDRDAVIAHHRDRFGPANTAVVVVGDVVAERAVDAVERVFGSWTAPARAEALPA
ncbi:MAG: insulinase family protein, partial [Acidobacteria bacterium]|nr:insulinase family protein [Acidobacteriota bacterium]